MESILLELTQAVIMGCTYSNLKGAGHTAYEGLSIQLNLNKKTTDVSIGDMPFATGKINDPDMITGSIDWIILNNKPRIVDIVYTKASRMGIDLIKNYGSYH
ncbi:MAG: hypothetical protein V1831_03285 [Candidatus Woesearchaeota archaeon]